MGQGTTFGSEYNYWTNHRGINDALSFNEGQLYVAQSKYRDDLAPTISYVY